MIAVLCLVRVDAVGRKKTVAECGKAPPLAKRGACAWDEAQRGRLEHNVRLVVHAVDDTTNRVYERAVRAFLLDVKRHNLSFGTYEERDGTLAEYLSDMCYVKNQPFSKASALFNGFMHIFEDHRNRLPVSSRALKSWLRMGFQNEGAPVPFEAVGLLLVDLFTEGKLYEGGAVLLQLDGWLREQDWGMLRASDVAESPSGEMALTLGRRERGEKVKTGSNQGVVISWPVTKAVMRAFKRWVELDELIFPMTQDKFRKAWHRALQRAGLPCFGPPHALRHAGASAYIAGGGCLESARRKGRWQTTAALQRYTKVHVLVGQRSRMAAEQLDRGAAFWKRPAEALQEAILASPAADSDLGRALLHELCDAYDSEVALGAVPSAEALPAGRPSTAGRARGRRAVVAERR